MSPPFRPPRALPELEAEAVARWRAWGEAWAMFARCHGCGEFVYVRGATRRKLLCLECYDTGGGM